MKYKYNDQWVDVNIKALDSMPVGTVVEYTGQASDIPVGWEQVTGQNKIEKTSETSPIFATVVDSYTSSTTDTYSCNYLNAVKGVVLWTNSDLTVDFIPTQIEKNLSQYDLFEVWFVHDKYANTFFNVARIPKGSGSLTQVNCGTTSGAEVADRAVSFSDTEMSFGNCFYRNSVSGNVVTDNKRNIPYKVVGYHVGIF